MKKHNLGTGVNRQSKPKTVGAHSEVKAHKAVTGPGMGSNLKLPDTHFAVHVTGKKDSLAKNVSNHMQVDKASLGHQDLIESGSGMKKGSMHKREKY